jgi:hypothetical protein
MGGELCDGAKSTVFTSSLRFAASCEATFALPLSKGVKDAGVGLGSASDGGCCGDAGDGDGSRCGRRTSTGLSTRRGDFGSGAADSLDEIEEFFLTSGLERASGERRRGGGVGERQRRSREARRKN